MLCRALLRLIVILGIGVAAATHPVGLTHAQSVTYAAGWQLVAGPEGSHLVGAAGSLYTFQRDDRDYETMPLDSTLHACWGYWAYFPTGGHLEAAPSGPACHPAVTPGQWTLVGNPAANSPAHVVGTAVVLMYGTGGYVSTTQLAPGQGAFLLITDAGGSAVAVQPLPPGDRCTVGGRPAPLCPPP